MIRHPPTILHPKKTLKPTKKTCFAGPSGYKVGPSNITFPVASSSSQGEGADAWSSLTAERHAICQIRANMLVCQASTLYRTKTNDEFDNRNNDSNQKYNYRLRVQHFEACCRPFSIHAQVRCLAAWWRFWLHGTVTWNSTKDANECLLLTFMCSIYCVRLYVLVFQHVSGLTCFPHQSKNQRLWTSLLL